MSKYPNIPFLFSSILFSFLIESSQYFHCLICIKETFKTVRYPQNSEKIQTCAKSRNCQGKDAHSPLPLLEPW